MTKFSQCLSDDLQHIEDCVKCGDCESLTRAAHKLKGAAANLSAVALSETASQVEASGRADDLEGAGVLLDQLQYESRRLTEQLGTHVQICKPSLPNNNQHEIPREVGKQCES